MPSEVCTISPDVTIIVPLYNRDFCVESVYREVASQSLDNLELIFVDDESTDGTVNAVSRLAGSDNRIKLLCVRHGGAGAARNAGIVAAQGQYIFFLDSDDAFGSPYSLERLLNVARQTGELIVGGSIAYQKRGKLLTIQEAWDADWCQRVSHITPTQLSMEMCPFMRFASEGKYNYLDYQFDAGFTRFLYKRDFLIENELYFPETYTYEDPVFFVNAMWTAGHFYAVPEVVYIWRVGWHVSSFTSEHLNTDLDAIESILLFSSQHGLDLLHELTAVRLISVGNLELQLLMFGHKSRMHFLEVIDKIDLKMVDKSLYVKLMHLSETARNDRSLHELPMREQIAPRLRLAYIALIRRVKSLSFFSRILLYCSAVSGSA